MLEENTAFLSARYINVILETLEGLGVGREKLLQYTTITEQQLRQEDVLLSFKSVQQVFINAVLATGIFPDELAFKCGLKANINAFGASGMAAISEKDFGSAVELFKEHIHLILPNFYVESSESELYFELRLRPNFEIDELVHEVIICNLIGSTISVIKTITGVSESKGGSIIHLPFPPKAFLTRLPVFKKNKVYFNEKWTLWAIPKNYFNYKLPLSNQHVAASSKILGDEVISTKLTPFINKIRRILDEKDNEFTNVESVGKQLGVSSRTIHRHLKEEGYSYRSLLTEVKTAKAKYMLSTTDMSIEALAKLLGYSSGSSFGKAFKKATGVGPSTYRLTH